MNRKITSDKNGLARDVTIFDVAEKAGVSHSTVSRVLNNKNNVNVETRERVLQAMTQLGYVSNVSARSLARGSSHVVGLLVDHLNTGYMGEIIRGIDEELEAHNYNLMLYTTHRQKYKEAAYVTKLTHDFADGLILIVPRNEKAYLETLQQRKFPYVLIDYQGYNRYVPSIITTNQKGGYDACSYLIGLGHRRIGFITGEMAYGCSPERLAGYQAALAEHGIPFDPELVSEGNFLQPQGYHCAQHLLSLPKPPTALFVSNDVMAFGAMEAARDLGFRIPDDLSIIGFDDVPQAAHVHPPLTTVCQPLVEMGRSAANLLLKYIANPKSEVERVELSTRLVIRESCHVPRALTE
ncbi:LacI family DNA-binding transcriptional regulator [Ktedonospora formicarum]|uniref:LacI family transcriptional regulator n=1 Tax=Ktedonospora formicarum TaxID=2778364 RepID=A0A8J3I9C8_9CHLR|nr:LacI family DNA-binding transcriptional regulator [Ktedonospora formicarum]GHO48397.1 LacI family transcriptional regulator [Ktedonospora formicarum]